MRLPKSGLFKLSAQSPAKPSGKTPQPGKIGQAITDNSSFFVREGALDPPTFRPAQISRIHTVGGGCAWSRLLSSQESKKGRGAGGSKAPSPTKAKPKY